MANPPKKEEKENQRKEGIRKVFFKLLLFFAILIVIGISVYFYIQYQNTQKMLQNPTIASSEEAKSLTEKVSRIIELPQGEDPTVATVSDKAQLPDYPFFQKATNGDKVLFFEKAKQAFLYRPSINKIIAVGSLNSATGQSSPSAATETVSPTSSPAVTTAKVKVAIYNGTQTAGLAASYAKKITSQVINTEMVQKANADGNYTENIVIDLTGKNSTIAKQIASAIDGSVGTLPKNEELPSADILVIVGE
jgi:uncharacterized protein (UPF0333 family)